MINENILNLKYLNLEENKIDDNNIKYLKNLNKKNYNNWIYFQKIL